ncbi:MAG: PEP-CTERM sorting domain-containing protein [Akkermansiaceae bacterium]|nr:PEP-CTERM sorting domain-containing protein [Akkermansiaceae bacterium]
MKISSKRNKLILSILLLASSLAPVAQAASIFINNHSFESPSVGNGSFTGAVPGWTITGGVAGAFNPATPTHFSGIGATDGVQNGYANAGATLSQTLTALFAADTQYTLTVDVGDRRDLVFPTYFIELFAGSTLLVQDNSSLTPNDGFLTSTLTYLSPASHPELGQPLQIRLRSTGSGIQQVNFDNVRLDAVPEPSSLAMLAVGAMAFCNFRRRITI